MYNRYIPKGNTYERVLMPEDTDRLPRPSAPPAEKDTMPPHTEPPAPPSSPRTPPNTSTSDFKSESAPSGGLFGANSPLKGLSALLGGEKSGGFGNLSGLGGILKSLKLDNLDTGDILLVLILLLLYLEGDNLELVITLGLMLLMGL